METCCTYEEEGKMSWFYKPNGPYTPMREFYPHTVSGEQFIIEPFELTQEEVKYIKMTAFRNYSEVYDLESGVYVRLMRHRGWNPIMSDTPMEMRTNTAFVGRARGHVLLAGLGIGMVIPPLLENPAVTQLTIIEKSPEIIRLVNPYERFARLPNSARLEVIEADIFTWEPPKGYKYGTVYFDVWSDISADNHPQMKQLHRRYQHRLIRDGLEYLSSWRKEDVYDLARS